MVASKKRTTKKLVPGVDHCIQPGCKKPVSSFGNCKTHKRTLDRCVAAKETSWPELVEIGRAVPPVKRGRKVGPLRAAVRAAAKRSKGK